jgi:hypothetical protein
MTQGHAVLDRTHGHYLQFVDKNMQLFGVFFPRDAYSKSLGQIRLPYFFFMEHRFIATHRISGVTKQLLQIFIERTLNNRLRNLPIALDCVNL